MVSRLAKRIVQPILSALIGITTGAAVSIAPVALIQHRHLYQYFQNLSLPMAVFFAICLIAGGLIAICRSGDAAKLDGQDSGKDLWSIKRDYVLTIIYFFWYTASAALCQKLGLTSLVDPIGAQINTSSCLSAACPIIPAVGLFLLALAVVINIRASANYQSWLIFMTAISLVFGVWLPLIALPGALIVIKWMSLNK